MFLLPCPGTGKLLPSERLLLGARAGGKAPTAWTISISKQSRRQKIYKKAFQPHANSLDLTKMQGTGPLGPEHLRLFMSLKGHCPRLSPRLPRGPAMAEMLQGASVCPGHSAAASAQMSSQARAQKQEGQVHGEPSQRLWEAWLRERPKHQKVRWSGRPGAQPVHRGWAAWAKRMAQWWTQKNGASVREYQGLRGQGRRQEERDSRDRRGSLGALGLGMGAWAWWGVWGGGWAELQGPPQGLLSHNGLWAVADRTPGRLAPPSPTQITLVHYLPSLLVGSSLSSRMCQRVILFPGHTAISGGSKGEWMHARRNEWMTSIRV